MSTYSFCFYAALFGFGIIFLSIILGIIAMIKLSKAVNPKLYKISRDLLLAGGIVSTVFVSLTLYFRSLPIR